MDLDACSVGVEGCWAGPSTGAVARRRKWGRGGATQWRGGAGRSGRRGGAWAWGMGCGRAGTRAARAKWRSEGARRGLGARAGEAGHRRRGWRGALRARLRRVGVAERQGSSGAATQRGRGDDGGVACGRQVHGRPVGCHGSEAARRRALVAACASTGRARRGRRARSSGVGRQWRGTARQQGSERGQAAAQHVSERTRVVLECLRAQRGESQRGRERKEREREWRERKKVHGLT